MHAACELSYNHKNVYTYKYSINLIYTCTNITKLIYIET